jgi:hypothetical protein
MSNDVTEFLTTFAVNEGYTVFDSLSGSIELGQTIPIVQSSGSVYGIWVNSNTTPSTGVRHLPGHPDWYPVYWGKDICPVSRMKAHVRGHANNGNINLPGIAEVTGKRLIYGAILVSRYEGFESLLHSRFQPLRGTSRAGRRSTIIRIEN